MTRVSLRPGKRPGEKRLPGGARLRVVDPCVDERQSVAVLDEIDVDVVEPEREREARPQNARTNFDRLAGLRRSRVGNFDRLGRRAVEHRPVSDLVAFD